MMFRPDGDGAGEGGTGAEGATQTQTAMPGSGATPRSYTEAEVNQRIEAARLEGSSQYRQHMDQWLSGDNEEAAAFLQSRGFTKAQAQALAARAEAAQDGEDPGFDVWLSKQPKSVQERLGPLVENHEHQQNQAQKERYVKTIESIVDRLPLGAKDNAMRRAFLRLAIDKSLESDLSPQEAVQAAHKEFEEDLANYDKSKGERGKRERMNRFVTPGGQAGAAGNAKEPETFAELKEFSRNVSRIAGGK